MTRRSRIPTFEERRGLDMLMQCVAKGIAKASGESYAIERELTPTGAHYTLTFVRGEETRCMYFEEAQFRYVGKRKVC